MHVWAMVLAAGQGSRLKSTGQTTSKQFIEWKGAPLFWHSALKLAAVAEISGILFVFPEKEYATAKQLLNDCITRCPLGIPSQTATGGETRQASVWQGLQSLPPECSHILIHDAARPFVSSRIIKNIINHLKDGHPGVIPGLQLKDTVKQVNSTEIVLHTPERSSLRLVQTPQGFKLSVLHAAHRKAKEENFSVTDDASILEAVNVPVLIIPGDEKNCKITTKQDLQLLTQNEEQELHIKYIPCIGFGYDVHSYGGSKPLVLGGIKIENSNFQINAHSDGDVLLHALIDALLGCAAAGDIGMHFPDTDSAYADISSTILLAEVLELLQKKHIRLTHVDLTIVAQAPQIGPYRLEIVKNITRMLHMDEKQVNLKATTEEHLGFTGALQGIKAMAAVTGLRGYNI